jgi:hypothetical protein
MPAGVPSGLDDMLKLIPIRKEDSTMLRRLSITCGIFVLALLAAPPQNAQEKGGTIRVQLDYTGNATVDQNHKIIVALWDSPDFAQPNAKVMPVAVQSTDSKNGTVTFSDVKKTPAYVSCALDPAGKWDGSSGPPPAGAYLGMYSKAPPTPEPIDAPQGKTKTVKITFDDTVKMM